MEERTYTVKQIADMLGTNQETVRRWIREKKLKSVQKSRRTGNVVSEKDLSKFLREMPKYAGIISGVATLSPFLAAATVVALVGEGVIAGNKHNEDSTKILSEDAMSYLHRIIKENDVSVREKKKLKDRIDKEIVELEKRNKEYQKALSVLEKMEGACEKCNGLEDESAES